MRRQSPRDSMLFVFAFRKKASDARSSWRWRSTWRGTIHDLNLSWRTSTHGLITNSTSITGRRVIPSRNPRWFTAFGADRCLHYIVIWLAGTCRSSAPAAGDARFCFVHERITLETPLRRINETDLLIFLGVIRKTKLRENRTRPDIMLPFNVWLVG